MKNFTKKIAEKGVYILLVLVIGIAGITGYMAKKKAVYESMKRQQTEQIQLNSQLFAANTEEEKSVGQEAAADVEYFPPELSEDIEVTEVVSVAGEYEDEEFIAPVLGETVGEYSASELVYSKTMEDWRTHDGVDIAGKIGTQVRAVKSGTVKKVYADELFGTTVEIEHMDGSESIYRNLQEGELVDEGSFVESGQVIGGIGATAACESAMQPHLHFELKVDGKNVNPFDYID